MAGFRSHHLFLLPGGEIQNIQTHGSGPRRVIRRRNQLLIPTIIQVSGFPTHQLPENKIHRVRYPHGAAEIPVQYNTGRILLRIPLVQRIGPAPAQKQLGHCLAEAIDALLDITDQKEVFRIARERPENHILGLIGVLIFVHHDLFETLRQLQSLRRPLRPLSRILYQQAQRPMLQIPEIRRLFLGLFLIQPRAVCTHNLEKLLHQRG